MKPPCCIVFDLDGTLLDSLDDIANALNDALRFHNLPTHDREVVRRMVGHGLGQLVNSAIENSQLRQSLAQNVLEHLKSHYLAQPFVLTKPYPGISELVRELKNAGHLLAVLSNKADPIAKSLVEHFFGGQFSLVRGEIAGQARKPDPNALFAVLESLIVQGDLSGEVSQLVSETMLVGDSEADIKTALNAGAMALAVLWGFRDKEALKNAGATELLADVAALRQRLGL